MLPKILHSHQLFPFQKAIPVMRYMIPTSVHSNYIPNTLTKKNSYPCLLNYQKSFPLAIPKTIHSRPVIYDSHLAPFQLLFRPRLGEVFPPKALPFPPVISTTAIPSSTKKHSYLITSVTSSHSQPPKQAISTQPFPAISTTLHRSHSSSTKKHSHIPVFPAAIPGPSKQAISFPVPVPIPA